MSDKKQISELTPEQEAQIPVYRERFRGYGLSTERVDQVKATAALKRTSKYLGLPDPEVWFLDSPFQVAVAANLLKTFEMDEVRAIIDSGELMSPENYKKAGGTKGQSSLLSYGSFESYWGAFHCYIAQVLPVEKNELHEIVEDIFKTCGVYASFEGLYIVSDRPVRISMNDNKELHNEHIKALEYVDGRGVYAFEGTRLPAWLYETPKDQIDGKRVLDINNVAVRLAAQKFLGMAKFLSLLGYKVIATDPNEEGAELIEIVMPDVGAQRFMKMVNPSTGEIHVERVKTTDKTTTDGWKTRTPDHILNKYGFELPIAKA